MGHCTSVLPDEVISLYYYCIAVKKYFFFLMLRLKEKVFLKSDTRGNLHQTFLTYQWATQYLFTITLPE